MRMRRSAALALALALTTGLAACGDDDDGGTVDDAAEEAGGSGGSGGDSADGDVDGEDSDIAAGFAGEECVEFAEAYASATAGVGGAFSGGEGLGDVEAAAEAFEAAADEAPEEVADAMRTVGAAYQDFAAALDEAGIDLSDPSAIQDPAAVAALTEASEGFSDPEFTAAAQRLDEFFANNCET